MIALLLSCILFASQVACFRKTTIDSKNTVIEKTTDTTSTETIDEDMEETQEERTIRNSKEPEVAPNYYFRPYRAEIIEVVNAVYSVLDEIEYAEIVLTSGKYRFYPYGKCKYIHATGEDEPFELEDIYELYNILYFHHNNDLIVLIDTGGAGMIWSLVVRLKENSSEIVYNKPLGYSRYTIVHGDDIYFNLGKFNLEKGEIVWEKYDVLEKYDTFFAQIDISENAVIFENDNGDVLKYNKDDGSEIQ